MVQESENIHQGTKRTIKIVKQNLKFLIEILPYFKGIEIGDTLDLTRSFTYLSNKEIWEQVRLY